MKIDFSAEEIVVTMTPDAGAGRDEGFARHPPGAKPQTFVVASRFGAPKTRLVQGLLAKTGGGLMYIECGRGKREPSTLAVPFSRTGSFAGDGQSDGLYARAANFVSGAVDGGMPVVVFGGDRLRWSVSFASRSSREQLGDTDRASATAAAAAPTIRRSL